MRGSSVADGIATRNLRFFTVYGSMGRPDMAYFRLVASALGQWNFKLTGDGNIRRDFTHVTDTVESIVLLTNDLLARPSGFHDTVNVGGGNSQNSSNASRLCRGRELIINGNPQTAVILHQPRLTSHTYSS